MKKTFLAALATGALMVGLAGTASATGTLCSGGVCPDGTTEYTDTYNPSDIYMSAGNHVTWTFDITADSGANHSGTYGFDPATEDVVWAEIGLNLSDDGWFGDVYEYADFAAGGNSYASWEVNTGTKLFDLTSLLSLNTDGTVSADLWSTEGDFYFNSAQLTAYAEAVPEPMSMLLMGTGLAGLMGIGARRKMRE